MKYRSAQKAARLLRELMISDPQEQTQVQQENLAVADSTERNEVFKGLGQPSGSSHRKEKLDLSKVTLVMEGSSLIDV